MLKFPNVVKKRLEIKGILDWLIFIKLMRDNSFLNSEEFFSLRTVRFLTEKHINQVEDSL